ncbi:MAG: MFS transporter [Janthinobacterium lividum]
MALRAKARDFPSERVGTLLVFMGAGVGTGGWVADIPRVREALDLSTTELGMALPGFGAGALAATLLMGQLAKRLGSGAATLCSAACFLVALLGPAFADSHLWLLATLLALGFTVGALDVSMNTHGAGIEQRMGRPVMSSFFAANSCGALLGAAVGGGVAALGGSARVGLLVPAAVAAVLLLLAWKVGMDGKGGRESRAAGAPSQVPAADDTAEGGSPRTTQSGAWVRWMGLWLTSLMLGISTALVMVLQGAVGDWSGLYLNLVVGAGDAATTLGFGCFSVAMAVSRLCGDRIVARIGPMRTVRFGAFAAAAGYALLLSYPGVLTACVGFALVGLGIGNILPVVLSTVGRLGKHPASAIATAMTIGYMGAMLGPILIGCCADRIGLRQASVSLLLVSTLLATIAAACVGHAGRLRPTPR